jgi:transcription elongation factor Elf1
LAVAVEPLESLRGRLTRAAPDEADVVMDTIRTAMQATKSAWGSCGHCKRRVQVEIQDSVAAINAAKMFIEQAEGRPGVADQAEADQLVINRTVYTTVSAEQALALLDAGDLDGLRAELQSSL